MLRRFSRRALLHSALLGGGAALLAACQPKIVEKVVKETVAVQVKETVQVEVTPAPKRAIELFQIDTMNYEPNNTVLNELVDEFNASHPEYKLSRLALKEMPQILARYSAGNPPTTHEDAQRDVLGLIDNGALLPVDDYASADPDFPKDWWPGVWGRYKHKGKIYAMAEDGQATYFTINVGLFERAGLEIPGEDWTNDEASDLGLELTIDKNGRHPYEAGFDVNNIKTWGFFAWRHANVASPIFLHYGATITDPNDHSRVTVNSPEMYEAMAWRCRQVLPPPNGPIQCDCNTTPTLYDDKVAMRSDGSWALVALETMAAQSGTRWVWRKWPAPKKETRRMTFMGDTAMFLPKTDEARQQGAWTWISWLFQPKQQAKWCLGTGFLPLTKGAYDYPTYQAVIEQKPWWGQSVEYMADADPDHWGWYGGLECKQAYEDMHCQILAGAIKEADLEAALAKCEEQCKKGIADATPA